MTGRELGPGVIRVRIFGVDYGSLRFRSRIGLHSPIDDSPRLTVEGIQRGGRTPYFDAGVDYTTKLSIKKTNPLSTSKPKYLFGVQHAQIPSPEQDRKDNPGKEDLLIYLSTTKGDPGEVESLEDFLDSSLIVKSRRNQVGGNRRRMS